MAALNIAFSYGRAGMVVLMVATLMHAMLRAERLDEGFVGLEVLLVDVYGCGHLPLALCARRDAAAPLCSGPRQ